MIDKMIGIAAAEVFNKEINEKIPSHCFEFIRGCMNNMVHLSFIPYDRDDLNQNVVNYNNLNNSQSISINQAPHTVIGNNYNNLTYIPQPNSQSHTSKTLPMPGRSHEESIELEKLNGCSMEMNNNGLINQPTPEELFFDNKYIGFNQWIEIPEPVRLFLKLNFTKIFFREKQELIDQHQV
jgi:hypothetical protein